MYLTDALAPVRERTQREDLRRKEEEDRREEEHRREEARTEIERLETVWNGLSSEEQEGLRMAALRGHPRDIAQRRPALAHSFCLAELRRRTTEEGSGGESA